MIIQNIHNLPTFLFTLFPFYSNLGKNRVQKKTSIQLALGEIALYSVFGFCTHILERNVYTDKTNKKRPLNKERLGLKFYET